MKTIFLGDQRNVVSASWFDSVFRKLFHIWYNFTKQLSLKVVTLLKKQVIFKPVSPKIFYLKTTIKIGKYKVS